MIKRTIKKPTQPIPKQTSLPKHRLEFPRFVITPCIPEPLFTLGKILIGISQPQSLPSIQSQEFGLGLMQRKREILLHWRERSKSFLPQVHSITSHGDCKSTVMGFPPAVRFSSTLRMPSLSSAGVKLNLQGRAVLRSF